MDGYTTQIILIVILIFIKFLFSSLEMAVIALRPSRLHHLANEGRPWAKRVLHISRDPTRFLASIQIGVTLTDFFASAATAVAVAIPLSELLKRTPAYLISGYALPISVFLTTAVLSYLFLILGELVPKRFGLARSETVVRLFMPIHRVAEIIIWPLISFAAFSAQLIGSLFGIRKERPAEKLSLGEFRTILDAYLVIPKLEKEMIEGILSFGDMIVRKVMIPRTDLVAAPLHTTVSQLADICEESGFSRIPVYEGSLDSIVGLVYAKDAMQELRDGKVDIPVSEIMREPLFFPEFKTLRSALNEMRVTSVHLAVVLDEHGGTAGIVTLEDLVEEIVGEIGDEFEREMPGLAEKTAAVRSSVGLKAKTTLTGRNRIVRCDDGSWLVDASAPVEEVNEQIGTKFPVSTNYDTVGGMILGLAGRIPKKGEKVIFEETEISVRSVRGNRILSVSLVFTSPPRAEQ